MSSAATIILAVIGGWSLTSSTLNLFQALHQFFLRRPSFSRYVSVDPASPTWALVTGASHGIGLAFAQELCARGVNVILHGRDEEKLNGIKTKLLAANPNRQIAIFVADASEYDGHDKIRQLVERIKALAGGGKLRILINNVGVESYSGDGPFNALDDTSLDEVDAMVNINALFPARLTVALLPVLSENTPALVINISSQASRNCWPFMVMYCATKAFNLAFSEGMAREMEAQGRDIETIGIPVGSVRTSDTPRPGDQNDPFSIEAIEMARSALDSAGSGKSILFSHWKHWMFAVVSDTMPKSWIAAQITSRWMAEKKKLK